MAFLVSPGVQVVEKDLTNIIPAVATAIGGYAGVFEWGPVLEHSTVSSEADLISKFGYPKISANAQSNSRDDWYAVANFLAYSNACQVVRILPEGARNAVSELDADSDTYNYASIKNYDDFLTESSSLINGSVYARYPGALGNGLGVLIVDASINDSDWENTQFIPSNTSRLVDLFDAKPGSSVWATTNHGDVEDEVHVVIYTTDPTITGTAGEILESYAFLSKAKNGKTADGGVNWYVEAVNSASKWVYLLNEETAATNGVNGDLNSNSIGATLTAVAEDTFDTFASNVAGTDSGVRRYALAYGTDGTSVTNSNIATGYDVLSDVEVVDVSLLITGSHQKTIAKYVIEIGETRKDCVTFVSPDLASAVTSPSSTDIVDYFNNSTDGFNSTSYAFFDSGWKRQYDRYNDEYFWIPLNPDMAGLVARTEATNDAWWSPAGLNRGYIKNVVKLSFNPNQTERDELYKNRVNPVVTMRGQGTLLFGDKTALSRPSAFDRINVRRLFIVLEKAIATAAKYQLFEFNDDFTRRLFVNAVEPFLADVKTRRGVTDFKVVCDESNNTGEVIDGNRFVADIYIKPSRSINFITLNFIAVRTGVSFNEVVGA